MLREMIKEEEKEDDVKSSRLAEDEKMGIERVTWSKQRRSPIFNRAHRLSRISNRAEEAIFAR